MSDTTTSGAPTSAPADLSGSTPPVGFPGSQPTGAFGSTRGSGLARGKRTPTTAAAGNATAPAGYKPSALEVIRTQSEYKNPFTGETSVGAPASLAPVEPVINEPAPQAAPSATQVTESVSVPPVPAARPAPPAPIAEAADETAAKPELKILPSEQTRRTSTSWEARSPEDEVRNERPTFRPERRDGRPPREAREDGKPFEPREPRSNEGRDGKPFSQREPRRDQPPRKFEPRSDQPARHERGPRPETPAPAPKESGGFFGWLKSLFGGKSDAPAATGSDRGGDAPGGDLGRDGNRRRHRGGRGRGGFRDDNRGPRDGQQPRAEGSQPSFGGQGGQGQGQGEPRDGQYGGGGGGRRRRRGGRGRFRGEGGGNGGGGDNGGGERNRDPRPEGQQGGGAI